MKKQLSLPLGFIVFGCMIVVSSVDSRNVDYAEGPFNREMIKKLEAERGEGPPSDLQNELLPETTAGPAASETTEELVPSDEIPEGCLKMDNDICLQNAEGWGEEKSCSESMGILGYYCYSWAKDTKRCCPNTCNSIQFTEEECNSNYADGTCTYPHIFTCHSDFTNGGRNTNACPEGSKILSQIECEEAAALLNFTFAFDGTWDDSPKGCYMHENSFGMGVFFNSHPIGAASNNEAPLCVKENSEILSHLVELEVENCTKLMMSQDPDGEAQPVRCIPEYMPCDCKNENWKTTFNNMYQPCNEDVGEVDYGKAYLCVHNHETCMEAFNYDLGQNENVAGLCMPDERPSNCEVGTWEELTKYREESNYGDPIDNCTEKMLQRQEWASDEENNATESDVSDEDDVAT